MKCAPLVLCVVFFITVSYGQNNNTSSSSDSSRAHFDCKPEFPGGDAELDKFIDENLITPPFTGGCGGDMYAKVVTRFLIDIDGSIRSISVLDSAGPLYNQEAISLVESLPKFQPCFENGKPVKKFYTLPVIFGAHRKKAETGY